MTYTIHKVFHKESIVFPVFSDIITQGKNLDKLGIFYWKGKDLDSRLKNEHYAAILLAAGFSSRMDRFKPLLKLGEQTIADRAISLFARHDVDVFLVAGWQKEELIPWAKNRDVHIIENPDFTRGMFTSVQAGLRHLELNHQASFVLPIDIPLVRPFTVKRLIEVSTHSPGKILYPIFNKKRGHPPLVPAGLFQHILNWNNNSSLKAALKEYEDLAIDVSVPDRNILFDMDTPEDYKAALDRLRRYQIPTDEECEIILNDICHVDAAKRLHCDKVAQVADRIGQSLIKAGKSIDLELIHASAVLHDVAREQPKHDAVGGELLSEMGFEMTGRIIAVHTSLEPELVENKLEAKVVYMADKFVQGNELVTLNQRFNEANRRFGLTPEIKHNIALRRQRALDIKKELEEITIDPIEFLIQRDSF